MRLVKDPGHFMHGEPNKTHHDSVMRDRITLATAA